MSAPRLKSKLTLQERQRTPDGSGGFSETWVGLGELWGEVQARGVSDGGVSGGDSSRIRYRVTVRAAPDGDPRRPKVGQRLLRGSRAFAIDGVSERDADGLWLVLWTREEILA